MADVAAACRTSGARPHHHRHDAREDGAARARQPPQRGATLLRPSSARATCGAASSPTCGGACSGERGGAREPPHRGHGIDAEELGACARSSMSRERRTEMPIEKACTRLAAHLRHPAPSCSAPCCSASAGCAAARCSCRQPPQARPVRRRHHGHGAARPGHAPRGALLPRGRQADEAFRRCRQSPRSPRRRPGDRRWSCPVATDGGGAAVSARRRRRRGDGRLLLLAWLAGAAVLLRATGRRCGPAAAPQRRRPIERGPLGELVTALLARGRPVAAQRRADS